jgi:hypothetical protein
MVCAAFSESLATRGHHPITRSHAPQSQRTDFAWRNKTFRKRTPKSLISLMAANQPFRGIVSFQTLSRRFISPFLQPCRQAPVSPAPLKSDQLIIAGYSEKGKKLSTKNLRASTG